MTQAGEHGGSGAGSRRSAPETQILGVTPQKASVGNPKPPGFAFWKGAAVGMIVVLPAVAGTVWLMEIGRAHV